jgi:peptide/nickel transport system permease protein
VRRPDPGLIVGAVLVALMLGSAVFAPVLAPYRPNKLAPMLRFVPPSTQHLLGTDQLGRDLFSRALYGGRTAFTVALTATILSLLLGIVAGLAAGYGPRWLDNALLLTFDALRSFPRLMLGLALVIAIGPSALAVIAVVVLTSAPAYGRIMRTQTMGLRHAEFVLAERSLGAGAARILLRHILPNVLGTLLILASMDIPSVIGIEAGMSFLGLGVRPPTASWGTILNDGFAYIRESPWPALAGGIPIVLATLGFTFLGEGLRDRLDVRLAARTP